MSPTMWVKFIGDKNRMVAIKDDVALGNYLIEIGMRWKKSSSGITSKKA